MALKTELMHRIAALMTCHNRREDTLRCLRSLQAAHRQVPEIEVDVFLTDDGCTDGTAEAVQAFDPAVQVIRGTGDLYWTGGMVAAWRAALGSGHHYDGFLWLNDDTVLDLGAIKVLTRISTEEDRGAITVGAFRDPNTGELTYGGVVRTSRWHPGRTRRLPIAEAPQDADTLNGNCVLVPASCVERIGILDPAFTHAMGDFDYGLRAREAGIRVIVAPGTIGACPENRTTGAWLDRTLPLRARLSELHAPRGRPYSEWKRYLKRHGAPLPSLLATVPSVTVVLQWMKAGTLDRLRRPVDGGYA